MSQNNDAISLTKEPIEVKTEPPSSDSDDNDSNEERKDIEEMCEKLVEKQEKILENVLEELHSIRNQLNSRKKKLLVEESGNPAKKSDVSEDSETSKPSLSMKNFEVKYTFKGVSRMTECQRMDSIPEEHFGVSWKFVIHRNKDNFGVYVFCLGDFDSENEWVEASYGLCFKTATGLPVVFESVKKFSRNGEKKEAYWGHPSCITWDELNETALIDGNLTLVSEFQIRKMNGIYKDNLREFDDSMEEFSDVVLVVNGQKFHVSKLFLSAQSPFFKSLFKEKLLPEVELSGFDADDFQNYLEVLYGHPAIDEHTVEGILVLSDICDTKTVIRKCEEFLVKESKKTLKKKLEMAVKFNLEQLKKICLSQIRNPIDVRSVIPGDIHDMDPSLTTALLEKSLSFYSIVNVRPPR
uniref:BTB domain-containing protein n=1 Tax=Caenorhabditis tropicalis TaxID=1561998 RepID=A0A1I7ULJ6_9PELO